MEKTNSTFVRPLSWMRALGLVFVMTLFGLQTASAQCPAPAGVSATTVGQSSATLVWNSGSADAVDHCFVLEVGGIGFACGLDQSIVELTLCEGVTPGLTRSGNQFTYTVTGLQPGTTYDWSLVEQCDGVAPPNNISGPCVIQGLPFTTFDDQFTAVPSNIMAPTCPLVSPGFVPNGSFDVVVGDGTTCAGTYQLDVVSEPALSALTPSGVAAYAGGGQGTYSFTGAAPGNYVIHVYETGPCNPATDPVVVNINVPDGTDGVAPDFSVSDLLGNVIADTYAGANPFFGGVYPSAAVLPDFTAPEGACSDEEVFFVFPILDDCDGLINAADAVTASATTAPASVVPPTQVEVTPDGFGTYEVDVHFAGGTSVVTITAKDASNNSKSVTIEREVIVDEDDLAIAASPISVTVPQCEDDMTVLFGFTLTGGCDATVVNNPVVTDFGANISNLQLVFVDQDAQYWEYSIDVEPGADPLSDFITISYTSALGTTTNTSIGVTSTQAAEDMDPVIIAADENVHIPACDATGYITYSFQVIDDCQPIVLGDIDFDDGGMNLTQSWVDVAPDGKSVYIAYDGTVAPGDYFPVITYQDVFDQQPLVAVTQDADQPADIDMLGNLTFTLPNCSDEDVVTFSVQITDDCDDPINTANANFFLDGDEIFPSFTNAAQGYFEFTEEISAANNGDLILATYTDGAGNFSAVDGLITVLSSPDTWAPIIVYPANDLNFELDPCDVGGVAAAFFQISVTDNCDGDIFFTGDDTFNVEVFGTAGATGVIFPSPGGEEFLLLAEPGVFQILITATDSHGNQRQEDFFIVVTQDPAPQDNLACNDNINVTLNDDCQALVVPDMILEGNPGCLVDADFDIVVVDGNIANGPIVDGCGEYNVHIELGGEANVEGFTGPFAPANWATSTDATGSATDNASVSFTSTTLTLETLGAGTGGILGGVNAMAAIGMPADGTVSFDYDYNGYDDGWDWFIVDLGGDVLATGDAAAQGSVSENVSNGEVLMFGIDDDGLLPIGPDEPSLLVIDNFGFAYAGAADVNFTECWGTLSAEDKTDPEIECPDDTDQAVVNVQVQTVSGELSATDPTVEITEYTCFLDGGLILPDDGDHYYDLYTFTVTQDDIFTFDLMTNFVGGSFQIGISTLYQGAFNPNSPCENVIAQSTYEAVPGGGILLQGTIGFATGQLDALHRIALPLVAGQTYTLLTTSWGNESTGDYTWQIYSDGNGLVDDSSAPGVTPVPTTEVFISDIICEDIDYVLLTAPETYVVDRNGNTIPGTMSTNLRNKLDYTGRPDISDNCGQILVTVSDTYEENGDCGDVIITRTFEVADKYNSDCTGAPNTAYCQQIITVRKPNINDVSFPTLATYVECDESFETDDNGNVHPSVSGYPFLRTAFGFHDLDQTYCNLGASYSDEPRVETCAAGYKLRREWNIFDWCDPGNNRIVQTQIKVGDFTAPTVTCPFPDWDQNGVPDAGYLTYSTGPFDCTAAFSAPLPTVTDNCSDWEVHTDIVTSVEVIDYNEYGQEVGSHYEDVVVASIPADAPSRYVGGIPLGCHRFVYTVTDECGNETVVECLFLVEDQVQPTAVCDDDLNISLGGSGLSRVYAEDIDEGSNDNCGPIRIEVRRLVTTDAYCNPIPPFYTPWGDYIDVTCCDVDTEVRIELRVWDDRNGDGNPGNSIYVERCDETIEYVTDNENTCWLDVMVEDKVRPYCIAPHDVDTYCDELPYGFDPYDTDQLADLFNVPVGPEAQDNCYATPEELPPFVNLHDCGYGTIIRRFRAVDASGNVSTNTCQQVIYVNERHNYEIKFPKDASAQCGEFNADTIEYNEIACDLLAVSVEDEFFSASGDECYKIFRTFRVINWCEYDGEADPVVVSRDEDCDGNPGDEDIWVLRRPSVVYYDRDNNEGNNNPFAFTKGTACDGMTNPTGYWMNSLPKTPANPYGDPSISSVGYWEYTQHIKVYDDVDPVITYTPADPFCSIDNVDCDGPVTYPFSVDENCTPDDLTIKVFLDAGADGIIDQDITSLLSGSYPDYTISGDFPIGSHAFEVHVEDGCNNSALELLPFQVVDCKAPTPICINGLAIELMPVEPDTDADGDGDIDTGAMGIWASDFIASPITDCSEPIKYSINRVGETPDMDQTGIILTCDDPATLIVEIYAWDSAYNPYATQPDGTVGGPNYDFCETYVLVQDNMFNLCGPGNGALVSGTIATEEDNTVEGVEVSLSGNANDMMVTEADGQYEFVNLELFYDYTVTPFNDANALNGVSTFDLVLISKHILGVTPLDSPYKMIAADVNNSESITTLDLIQLRKLILTIDTEFSNNTSWRFVDAAFNFPDESNPWLTDFPEVINLNDLNSDMVDQNFVAVKIGDVNASAATNFFFTPDDRTNGTFAFETDDTAIKVGNEYTVEFTAADIASIQGYQATLTFDATALELVDMIYGVATEDNFGMRFVEEGMITTSWNGEANADEVLFSLVFRANADAQLSELLGISSRYTKAEAYNLDDETLDVAINFNNGTVASAGFELYQNTPNPFKGETLIGFNIPEAAEVTIRIHDVTGKALKMIRGDFAKGYNNVTVNAKELPAVGVLYYTIETADYTATKKMIIVE